MKNINEGKGISDVIKTDIEKIYNLYLLNSFSTHAYNFENDKEGYRDIIINFNKKNNYNSNITIDKNSNITMNIGIPINGKEKRIKENIAHELTHIIEILGLGNKEYPKYNNIKNVLRKFESFSKTKEMKFICDVFYKTLDNEVNANVAQTYIYVYSDGRCSKIDALNRLNQWDTYKFYDNIKNIDLNILEQKLNKTEVEVFNILLEKNNVRTITFNDVKSWLKYWFKIFKRKSDIFLKNSERILKEVEEDWKKFESYANNEYIPKESDYSLYVKKYNNFR